MNSIFWVALAIGAVIVVGALLFGAVRNRSK